jgi:hypothetical protein
MFVKYSYGAHLNVYFIYRYYAFAATTTSGYIAGRAQDCIYYRDNGNFTQTEAHNENVCSATIDKALFVETNHTFNFDTGVYSKVIYEFDDEYYNDTMTNDTQTVIYWT